MSLARASAQPLNPWQSSPRLFPPMTRHLFFSTARLSSNRDTRLQNSQTLTRITWDNTGPRFSDTLIHRIDVSTGRGLWGMTHMKMSCEPSESGSQRHGGSGNDTRKTSGDDRNGTRTAASGRNHGSGGCEIFTVPLCGRRLTSPVQPSFSARVILQSFHPLHPYRVQWRPPPSASVNSPSKKLALGLVR